MDGYLTLPHILSSGDKRAFKRAGLDLDLVRSEIIRRGLSLFPGECEDTLGSIISNGAHGHSIVLRIRPADCSFYVRAVSHQGAALRWLDVERPHDVFLLFD